MKLRPRPRQPAPKCRIKEITLENAACFEKITIPFSDNITVLVGTNGTGKTTVLNAIVGMFTMGRKIMFNPAKDFINPKEKIFYETLKKQNRLFPLCRSDNQVKINLSLSEGEEILSSFIGYGNRKYYSESLSGEFSINISHPEMLIPLGINRAIDDSLIDGPGKFQNGIFGKEEDGMSVSFDSGDQTTIRLIIGAVGSSVKNLKQWLVNQDYLNLQAMQKGSSNKVYDYFRENLSKVMPPEQSITLKEIVDMEPIFSTRTGDVPVGGLSSGFQSVLAVYWNILYNLLSLYPDSENPFIEPAIVLIDEIDAHLHPEWQQVIVHSLRTLFPNVQFIMATHSPLIVSGCGKNEAVFLKFDDENKCVIIDDTAPINPKGWLVESLLTGPFNLKSARGAEVSENIELAKSNIVKNFVTPLTDAEKTEIEVLASDISLPPDDPLQSILELKNLRKMLEG
jgi:energy-coupling factor transporter ATP-binding protein EcfA2